MDRRQPCQRRLQPRQKQHS